MSVSSCTATCSRPDLPWTGRTLHRSTSSSLRTRRQENTRQTAGGACGVSRLALFLVSACAGRMSPVLFYSQSIGDVAFVFRSEVLPAVLVFCASVSIRSPSCFVYQSVLVPCSIVSILCPSSLVHSPFRQWFIRENVRGNRPSPCRFVSTTSFCSAFLRPGELRHRPFFVSKFSWGHQS